MARCAGSQPGMGSCQVNFVRFISRSPACAPVGGDSEIKGLFEALHLSLKTLSKGPWSC